MSKGLTDAIIKSDTLLRLQDRRERNLDGKLLSRTYNLRDRLLLLCPRHRVALTRLFLCAYSLAIERFRWREQRRDRVERQWRLSRTGMLCTPMAARASFFSTLASTYSHVPRFAPPGGRTIDLLRELLGWSDCLTALIMLREFKAHPLHIHINNLFFIRN
ncbi:hypothetical protein M422DRAFT_263659 [Sphaerobolus stellatus SS14]|uniref:Uncharacterized protein n=1 Tax=Sphaerobolus stellatus (strain SS14) TaxID=990650 RepID=A0A0C9UHL9_SPHS4|nr:hypothetical protein M422DRAFT_263659 [Sphaerobolus stellatus SS14]